MVDASEKRKDFSLQEKRRILECYDKLPKIIQRIAAGILNILQSPLFKILKKQISH
jgi:hypothetical protein